MNDSYEISEPILEDDEFQIDWNGILPHDNSKEYVEERHPAMSIDFINNDIEPTKRQPNLRDSRMGIFSHKNPIALHSSRLILHPDNDTNVIANELFQVTNNMRRASVPRKSQFDIFGADEDGEDWGFGGKRLNNDKVEKMVNEMGLKHGDDFELDDQLRTRFYKGRFSKVEADGLDLSLNNYLEGSPAPQSSKNEDKENLAPFPDPLKTVKNKDSHSIKKSNKVFFRSPRRSSRTSIPVLKPLANITNVDLRKEFTVKRDVSLSPRRVCVPQHRNKIQLKPSIKYHDPKLNIFIVDSSTGSVNDATKFGTELNASNCEDFPLPEDANEIVQIPTNDDKTKVQKMAIIKVLANKFFHKSNTPPIDKKVGFYTPQQFEVYNGGEEKQTEKEKAPKERKVSWADNLEW